MRILVTILCLLAAAAFAVAADDPASLDRQWAQATIQNDPAALERILADDLVYIHSSGQVDSKAQFIGNLRSGKAKYRKIDFTDVKVRTFGDAAVVQSRVSLAVTSDGRDSSFDGWFTHVYAKRGGKWQMVAHQSTRITQ